MKGGKLDSVSGDAFTSKQRKNSSARMALGDQHLELSGGNLAKNARPQPQNSVVDFGKTIQATKSDGVICQSGERRDWDIMVKRVIAPEGVRETNQSFGGKRVRIERYGLEMGIREAVLDAAESRGAGVTKPGYLNRGGLAGESEEAVAHGMGFQVDENVDLVMPDPFTECFVIDADGRLPMIGKGTQALGNGVRAIDLGITTDIKLSVVV